jgi:hypothetical protein
MGPRQVLIRPARPLDPRSLMHLLKERFGPRIQIAMGPKYCCAIVHHRFRLSAGRDRVVITLLQGSSVETREMDLVSLQNALGDVLSAERKAA